MSSFVGGGFAMIRKLIWRNGFIHPYITKSAVKNGSYFLSGVYQSQNLVIK